MLFCKEFKLPYGIFRYKNQSAIETEPIDVNGILIGWQAKFYDGALSNYKNDILEAINGVKQNYPNIRRILLYTNQEWGQNRGLKPKGLKEIEEKAKELNIEIEWRTASFFESEFVCVENEIIAKLFFSLDKNIFDLTNELQNHTENLLYEIKTEIRFNNQKFTIERSEITEKLKNNSNQIIILSGSAGVGKTAVVKMHYEKMKSAVPFYVFKAVEFNNLRTINDFFRDCDFYKFIEAHKDCATKIVVIDSAEKLLDLNNTEPFKEFLHILIKEKWKVIFTTRKNYVEDLNYQFFEIYNIVPLNIEVKELSTEKLQNIAAKYSFSLPTSETLFELLKNPFYLNEYLKSYSNENINYADFKNKLWNKIIKKSKPAREQCFLNITFERAKNGQFYIPPKCDANILIELVRDGILGYDTPGYFITHDIYEEWALEKIIESEYLKKDSIQEFFKNIGDCLPIRRCFRNWLSEKLLLKDENIKRFIESIITSNEIQSFWKDEVLISVLRSDYSESFFKIFKEDLLADDQASLKRIIFLLRLACKEVDYDIFKQLGLKELSLSSLKYIFTKPQGLGWDNLIKFIFENLNEISIQSINFVLPVLHEWNSKYKEGQTTKLSSLIALRFYKWTIEKDIYLSRDDSKEKLIQTIIFGASEIKEELKEIFEEIFKNKWKNHRTPYYDFSIKILTSFDGIFVVKALPEYVMKLADLFWSYTHRQNDFFYHYSINIEQYFGIEENFHLEYFPASAFQTPIYWLLQISPKETIDFVVNFVNKSITHYANSGFDQSVIMIKIFFDDKKIKEQYLSHCLWNMYRGTSSPVSPYLLQSIHMALEKYLLEYGENASSDELESLLIYLLKNSVSASISAVVASIVLAYPDKTFNVAKILFKTREFIIYDTQRFVSDQTVKSLYSMGFGLNYQHKIFQDERIKTCEDKHRKYALEHLFLNYQLFRSAEVSEEEAKRRQEELWKILDDYYNQLLEKSEETEEDKTWRLFLARMDRRKMKITMERSKEDIVIQFNPEIEPEIKEFREKTLSKSNELIKYSSLKIWANYKMKNNEEYKNYEKYENNPKQALNEVREIIEEIKKTQSQEFILFNYSIPAEVCSILIRDYLDILSAEDMDFCKNIILESASSSLRSNYQYQIHDGVESAISVLPILFKIFPEERATIKTILLITLFDPHNIGMYAEFSDFPTNAIKELFNISFDDAQSLLFGYLYLKPKYEELRRKILKEKYRRHIYEIPESEVIDRFLKNHKSELQKIIDNKLTYEELGDYWNLDLDILSRAFQLIPLKTDNEIHEKIVKNIISSFIPKIFSDRSDQKVDYQIKHDFLETYAHFVLTSSKIKEYLKPFIDNFNTSEVIADLFQEFIIAEDGLNTYENFWIVWNYFKEKVIEICKNRPEQWNAGKIIKSYLFALSPWKESAKEWHSIKDREKKFFEEISKNIGYYPPTFYSITKLLNGVGSRFLDDGICWLYNSVRENENLFFAETIDVDSFELLLKKYIFSNSEKIKKEKELKNRVMIILNFLIKKGSTISYMIRESLI